MSARKKENNDAELIARYAAGDEDAFRELIDLYKNGLYAFLRRFLNQHDLIEDVFQETFLQLYTSRATFDVTRPIRPWLFTIAANKAKDALRKRKRTAAITIGTIVSDDEMSFEEVLNVLTSDKEVPYDQLERKETETMVRDVIGALPENLKEILIFAYFNKFSYKQMADMLSIPIGTVKSRLHSAVARFAKEWEKTAASKELR